MGRDFDVAAYQDRAEQLRGQNPRKAVTLPTCDLVALADMAKANDPAAEAARRAVKGRPKKPLVTMAEYFVALVDRAAKLNAPKTETPKPAK